MVIETCEHCLGTYTWHWEEAFDKFGFHDGDGCVETGQVEDVLTDAGYTVQSQHWGLHNVIIISIKENDRELIPDHARKGYDNPRTYLPDAVITLLDEAFPSDYAFLW